MINIYAPTTTYDKKMLWATITTYIYQLLEQKIVLAGDFNATTSIQEKRWGIIPPKRTINNYKHFIINNALQ